MRDAGLTNTYSIHYRAAATALVACLLLAAGCGRSKMTEDQAKVFTSRVAPKLEGVLHALDATNASPIKLGRSFDPRDGICVHATIDGSLWGVHRDGFSYLVSLHPPAAVDLVSMLADDARIRNAVTELQNRLAPAAQADKSMHLQIARQIGDVNNLNATVSPTNEMRRAANKVTHIAQALGYRSDQGGIIPGKDLGVILHYSGKTPNNVPLVGEDSGGYLGLYSASTNLKSIDLLVLLYQGKAQAILQRSEYSSSLK